MNSLHVASRSNKEPQTLRTGLQYSLSRFQPWKCSTSVKTSLRGCLTCFHEAKEYQEWVCLRNCTNYPSPLQPEKVRMRTVVVKKTFSFVHQQQLPWLPWNYFQYLVNQKLVLRDNRSNSGVVLDISCFPQRETKILLAPLESFVSPKVSTLP